MEALHRCQREKCVPAIARLNDPNKTALSFAYKSRQSRLKRLAGRLIKAYLQSVRRMQLNQSCLLLAGFEGTGRS